MTGEAAYQQTVGGIRNALRLGLHTVTNTTLARANAARPANRRVSPRPRGADLRHERDDLRRRRTLRHDADPRRRSWPGAGRVRRERAGELGMRFLWYTPTEYCRLSPIEWGLGAKACNAGEYSICIEPNGDVLPCQSYYKPVGNLLRRRLTRDS